MSIPRSFLASGLVLFLIFVGSLQPSASAAKDGDPTGIQVLNKTSEKRVDILIDGQLFTSYIYPDTMKKPVLFPIRTSEDHSITRGFPLEAKAGERVDHPHHVGLWFNHGDVNGFDFWNNSDAIPASQASKMGTIVHRKVLKTQGGPQKGILTVSMDWVQGDGKVTLREETTFVFRRTAHSRSIDRITKLTALKEKVLFKDNKEGVLGLRVTRALEHPSNSPEVFTDSAGRPMSVPKLDNTGVTGLYRSSEGKSGDAVWGTRGSWAMLSGIVEGEKVTVAFLDQPKNPGFPTYWHARGYGLFAANMLGEKVFTNGEQEFNFPLEPGKSALFHYRIIIFSGDTFPEQVDAQQKIFAAEVK